MCARKKYDPLLGPAPKKKLVRIERWDETPTEMPRPSPLFIVILIGAIVLPLLALIIQSTLLQPPVVGRVVSKDSPISYYNPGYAVISIRESSSSGNSTLNPVLGNPRQIFIPETLYDSLIINQEYSFKCATNLERQTFCEGILSGNGLLDGLNLPGRTNVNPATAHTNTSTNVSSGNGTSN